MDAYDAIELRNYIQNQRLSVKDIDCGEQDISDQEENEEDDQDYEEVEINPAFERELELFSNNLEVISKTGSQLRRKKLVPNVS